MLMTKKTKKPQVFIVALFFLLSVTALAEEYKFDPNHTLYEDVLNQYVKEGLVDYAALQNDPHSLNRYLTDISRLPKKTFKSWEKDRQLAFLINLYNAATLKLIVDHYPVESIKDIGWFLKGPWDQKFVNLFGDTITLNTLEHGIIRKDYDEPRIHMTLVCAAMGCPTLRNEPYVGEKLDAQLDEDTKKFLNSKKGLQIDRSKKTVYLSFIFKWFSEDFVNKYSPESGFEGFKRMSQL